jgi:hypothetical protein
VGQTPLVNFCNQNNPRARTTRSPEPRFVGPRTSTLRIPPFGERPQIPIHVGETLPPRTAPCRNRARPPSNGPSPGTRRSGWSRPLRGASSRGFTGQGPMWLSPFDAFRRDCSRRKLRPDPIGSGTTCRELVTTLAGEASAAGAMRCACALYEPTRAGPLARDPPNDPLTRGRSAHDAAFAGVRYARAASHDLPRRRPRSAAPEVPFIDGLPILMRAFGPLRPGVGSPSTDCPQPVDYRPAPFRSSWDPPPFDVAMGREDSAPLR